MNFSIVSKQMVLYWGCLLCLALSVGACQPSSKGDKMPQLTANILHSNQATTKKLPIQKGFAVVELFTSEGCSSCPPADKVASEIVQKAHQDKQAIYVLTYHVDYWDRLGWKDRFSSAAFSQRQYWYAQLWRSPQVYTPQMVVNGEVELVGSRRSQAQQAIQEALQHSPSQNLEIILKQQESVNYTLKNLPKNAVLQVAWLQKEAHTEVKRGENSGEKLVHHNIVRAFQSIQNPAEEGSLTLPAPLQKEEVDFILVCFVQDAQSGKILQAQALPISKD